MTHKYDQLNAFPQTIAETFALKNVHLSYSLSVKRYIIE